MNGLKRLSLALATAGALASGSAQAGLESRAGGTMLYDNVLNITWLADANYAKTSVYDADGLMSWNAANTWAANLVFGGYDDWRLAANSPVGVDWNTNYSPAGTTDSGYNITSTHSELSYMYHVNLSLKSSRFPSGNFQTGYGVHGNGTTGGQANVGLVNNLQSNVYWSGTAYPGLGGQAFGFDTGPGSQGLYDRTSERYAWAVRSGDVAAPIPEPETYAMMLAGLALLGVAARRRKQKLMA